MTTAETAVSRGLACCQVCRKLQPLTQAECPRCGATLHPRISNSLQRTVALLITATLLLIPANLYPIMITQSFKGTEINTILGGIVRLLERDSIPVALVIFIASVVVPLAKLAAMYYLVWSVSRRPHHGHRQRTGLYRMAEFIGKWSMVDVFVVAILIALVHLGELLVIEPGIAAYSFAGVVLLTMIAAESFDPRLMWDQRELNHGRSTT